MTVFEGKFCLLWWKIFGVTVKIIPHNIVRVLTFQLLAVKMAFQIGKIDCFEESSETWTCYKERLDQYFLANEVQDQKKVPALLALIGSRYWHSGSVVDRLLCDREVAGSIPGRVIPKTLKMVLAALSLGSQH